MGANALNNLGCFRKSDNAEAMRSLLLIIFCLIALTGCNITSGSKIVVGATGPAISASQVKVYLRPPTKYEEVAILSANSKNAFANEQSLTDSAIEKMKEQAAGMGANGILLQGSGMQNVGTTGTIIGSTFVVVPQHGMITKGVAIRVLQ